MSEMTRELEIAVATPGPETLPGDVIFVEDALTKVGHAMGRYMDPTPISHDLLNAGAVSTDEKIAEILSRVKDDSPKIDPGTEQGIAEATENMIGRAEAAIGQAADPVVKREIKKFEKKGARGVASFLTKPVNFGRRHFLKAVSAGALAAVMASCAPNVIGPVIIPDGGEGGTYPTVTETAPLPTSEPTETPTETASPARPEQENEEFKGYIVDPQDNSIWRMQADDFTLAGNSPGIFSGWIEEESVPATDRQPGIRWGRWANSEGMGIERFIRNDMVIDKGGEVWVMLPEDYKLVGETPGVFGSWIPEDSVPANERQDEIRWGLWSNSGGQGRVRFVQLEEKKK